MNETVTARHIQVTVSPAPFIDGDGVPAMLYRMHCQHAAVGIYVHPTLEPGQALVRCWLAWMNGVLCSCRLPETIAMRLCA